MESKKQLAAAVRERAGELGFDLSAIVPATPSAEADRRRRWLEAGRAGSMAWLARTEELSEDPARLLPGARSVVVVASSYVAENPSAEFWDDPLRGRVARYAWGLDYHEVFLPKLRELAEYVSKLAGQRIRSRAFTDSGPLPEKETAIAAGLGFRGKNSLVVSPALGSYLFLGELLLDVELEPDSTPVTESCGECEVCRQSCPAGALEEPYLLDARRCVSYLTVEHRGSIPAELRPRMGRWVLGCDECQQSCPWVVANAKPGRSRFLRFDPDLSTPRLEELLALDEPSFRARFGGTPVARAGLQGLRRNAAIALGNGEDPEADHVLKKFVNDANGVVREHVAWAIQQLERPTPN